MGNNENLIELDYSGYSKAAIKFFVDSLHQIKPGPIDIPTILEVVDFCQNEGKTSYNSFERCLVGRLIDSITNKSLPVGTKLLIAAYLSRIADFTNQYQRNLAQSLTKESISSLLY